MLVVVLFSPALSLASGVESAAVSLGLSVPKLTSEQLMLRPVRMAIYSVRF